MTAVQSMWSGRSPRRQAISAFKVGMGPGTGTPHTGAQQHPQTESTSADSTSLPRAYEAPHRMPLPSGADLEQRHLRRAVASPELGSVEQGPRLLGTVGEGRLTSRPATVSQA